MRRHLLPAVVLVILLGYVVWPQVLVYGKALGMTGAEVGRMGADTAGHGAPTLRLVREVLGGRLYRSAVVNSLLLAALSVALAGALGASAAYIHERFRFPGRSLLLLGAVLPLALPPLVGMLAFWYLVGPVGIVPRALAAATGAPAGRFVLLDWPGMLAVHTYSFSVYFFVLTKAGFAGLDQSRELAARSLGAGPWRRLTRLTLPALMPYLAGAALLTFMISMGSYSAPKYMTSGKPYIPILTVEIAYQYESGNYGRSAVLASVLSLICLGVLAALQFGLGSAWRDKGGGTKGAGREMLARPLRGRAARWTAAGGAGLFCAAMAAPLGVILLTSLADMRAWTAAGTILPPRLTLDNYAGVFATRGAFMHPVAVSFLAAAAATALNLVVGVASAWLIARGGRRLRLGVDLASMLPLSLPGTVVAFNVVVAFGTGGSALTGGFALRNTLWILVLVYFVRQIPMALRPLGAAMARADPVFEQAARSLGAGPARVFWRVVLPQLWGGILAAALICFVTGAGEFVASVLVSSIRWRPISIEIATALADSDGLGPASAYAAILMAMTAAALLLYGRLAAARARR